MSGSAANFCQLILELDRPDAWGGLGTDDAWTNGDSPTDHGNPKYRALVDFANANSCWWPGCEHVTK